MLDFDFIPNSHDLEMEFTRPKNLFYLNDKNMFKAFKLKSALPMKISITEVSESFYFMSSLGSIEVYILIKPPGEEPRYLRKILNESYCTMPVSFSVVYIDLDF